VGKSIGDTARVNAPGGIREFDIIDIFISPEE